MEFDPETATCRAAGAALLVVWAASICAVPAVVASLPGTTVVREARQVRPSSASVHDFPEIAFVQAQAAPASPPAAPLLGAMDAPRPIATTVEPAAEPTLESVARINSARAEAPKSPRRAGIRKPAARRVPPPSSVRTWPCVGAGICAWQDTDGEAN